MIRLYRITLIKLGALTALIQAIGAITVLSIVPLFEIKFPTEPRVYIFLGVQ